MDILNEELEQRIWRLRHECHWSIRRIARRLNLSCGVVSQRLAQVEQRRGVRRNHPLPKLRTVRPISLSRIFNA